MLYRGFTIEKEEGVQVGHRTNAGLRASVGLGTRRQSVTWRVTGPDGYTTARDTLKEAKAAVDSYLD